jgi:16S rRNA (cytosine967-C5)-methyltransferase
MLPEENEIQVENFLASHADFKLVPFKTIWKDGVSTQENCLSLTPAQHQTDGFFAAVMERDAAPVKEEA